MVQLTSLALPKRNHRWLAKWQGLVDSKPTFASKVNFAHARFRAANTTRNKTFQTVRSTLREMHGPLIRCCYCEDSAADEVEHIFPKSLYPEWTFVWENLAFACGPCNVEKGSKFSVFTPLGSEINVAPPPPRNRPANWTPTPPPTGNALLINPRAEDPLAFLWLDIADTFRIEPRLNLNPTELRRAQYTRDTLDLNRDYLRRSRAAAFEAYRALLAKYVDAKISGRRDRRSTLKRTIGESPHRTVWLEMRRQRKLFTDVEGMFDSAPEALGW